MASTDVVGSTFFMIIAKKENITTVSKDKLNASYT